MTLIRVIPAVLRGVSGRCCLPETKFNFLAIDLEQHLGYVLGGDLRRVGIVYPIVEFAFASHGGATPFLLQPMRSSGCYADIRSTVFCLAG